MGGALVALTAGFVVHLPQADAAKVRKKPPQQPLASTEASPDAVGEYDDLDASAPPATPAPAATRSASTASPTPAIPYPRSGLICLYGEEIDPGTKEVRCLSPEELNPPLLIIVNSRPLAEQLGMLSKTSSLLVPDGGVVEPDAGVVPEPDAPFEARVVRVSFENGAVGGALRSLRNRTDDMAKCIDDNGGLRSESARLKLLFFVRADRKASGIIVASARNIPVPVVRCIRKVIEEGTIGHPSANPVGVTALIELKEND